MSLPPCVTPRSRAPLIWSSANFVSEMTPPHPDFVLPAPLPAFFFPPVTVYSSSTSVTTVFFLCRLPMSFLARFLFPHYCSPIFLLHPFSRVVTPTPRCGACFHFRFASRCPCPPRHRIFFLGRSLSYMAARVSNVPRLPNPVVSFS